jgi:hypothetical protein
MPKDTDSSASISPVGRRLTGFLALLGVVIAGLSQRAPEAYAAECGSWTHVGGASSYALAYPDTYSQYWLWSFSRTRKAMTTAFRLRGQFPYARYMSFQTYSATQEDTLLDFQIVPDPGSINPFHPNTERDAVARAYTVWFVPPNSTQTYQNSVWMPSDALTPTLVLRIGRADRDEPDGGVPLPTVEAFDDHTGQWVACPAPGVPRDLLEERPEVSRLPSPEDSISFYRVSGTGVMPHTATEYLVARLAAPWERTLAVLRFALPSFPDTYNQPGAPLTGLEDVRYLGLCVHGLESTHTSECLCDDELRPRQSSQGVVTVVVGPEEDVVRQTAHARGYHYLSWRKIRKPLLMYRQLLPHADFPGSVVQVPVYSPQEDRDAQRAETYIGVYAPVGIVCKISAFLEDGSQCGLP